MLLDKRKSDLQAMLDVWLVLEPTFPYTSYTRSEARPTEKSMALSLAHVPRGGGCRDLQVAVRGSMGPLTAGSGFPSESLSPPQPRAVTGSLEAPGGPAESPCRRDETQTGPASRGLSH